MPKVAVASTDGITVNEHFGRSKEFWIYEVNETGDYKLFERREIPQIVDPAHAHAASGAVELLSDVEVVFANQIGPRAESELRGKGVLAFAITGSIDKALQAYGQRGKLIRNWNTSKSTSGCQPGGSFDSIR